MLAMSSIFISQKCIFSTSHSFFPQGSLSLPCQESYLLLLLQYFFSPLTFPSFILLAVPSYPNRKLPLTFESAHCTHEEDYPLDSIYHNVRVYFSFNLFHSAVLHPTPIQSLYVKDNAMKGYHPQPLLNWTSSHSSVFIKTWPSHS